MINGPIWFPGMLNCIHTVVHLTRIHLQVNSEKQLFTHALYTLYRMHYRKKTSYVVVAHSIHVALQVALPIVG